MVDFAPAFNVLLDYLPENERQDMSSVVQYFNQQAMIGNSVEEVNGRLWMPCFNEKMALWSFDNWKPQKNDVLISSFAKTGTTWVSSIVNRLINKDDERIMEMVGKMFMPHYYLSTGLPKKFEMLEKLPWKQKLLITHLPTELVNIKKITAAGAKIIYTMRNPKDTTVSFFNMLKTIKQVDDNWDNFFENFVSGKVPAMLKDGEWYVDHLLDWYKHKDDENFLFVVYEDMKENPRNEIQRIAEFLEVDLSHEELSRIVEVTSFQAMKANAHSMQTQVNFFRKGEVGNWKNYFTVSQSELMDKLLKEKLSSTDISFTYE